jgi:transcriptional regulator with XRE-family HTH domain
LRFNKIQDIIYVVVKNAIVKNERGDVMGKYLTSRSALAEIGARLKAYRIDFPLSQEGLAHKSGVATRSISRLENGNDVQFGNLIKLLIALDLDGNLDMLVPDPQKRPSKYLNGKSTPPQRRRARIIVPKNPSANVKWGDENQ